MLRFEVGGEVHGGECVKYAFVVVKRKRCVVTNEVLHV